MTSHDRSAHLATPSYTFMQTAAAVTDKVQVRQYGLVVRAQGLESGDLILFPHAPLV